MPERNSYETGTPSWVDLSTPDVAGARRFYGELFGWDAEDAGPPEQTGGYGFFTQDGKKIAGVGPVMQENQPTVWMTYVASDDAEATVEKARANGATIHVEPMEVMDAGKMAMFTHPGAGALGVWQAGRHTGADLVNEPVSLAWNELLSRDVDGAKAFLQAVFGLQPDDQDMGGGMIYTLLNHGDRGVAGLMPMPGQMPAEVPSFWQTYFAVADTDATVAKAQELGGSVMMEPMDAPGIGRMAALTDPYGATFSVIALDPSRG